MAAVLKTINGTISRTNDRGLQIQEQPGLWLNLSKFASPPPTIPPTGSEVELSIDAAGFVREIRLLDAPGNSATVAELPHVVNAPPQPPTAPESPPAPFSYERATLYARCLQTAATFFMGVDSANMSERQVEELADIFFRRCVAVGARKS